MSPRISVRASVSQLKDKGGTSRLVVRDRPSTGASVLGIIGTGVLGIIGTGVLGTIGTGVLGTIGTGVLGTIGTGVLKVIGVALAGVPTWRFATSLSIE